MNIVIDFDGTCVTHEFPEIGKEIGAVPVLKKIVEAGHNLILFTMRDDHEDNKKFHNDTPYDIIRIARPYLQEAINWFKKHEIPLWGIQKNPEQHHWTSSPKAYGHIYIDDAALGCPLKRTEISNRSYVDWEEVEKQLTKQGII